MTCRHKNLTVVLKKGMDQEICRGCGEIVRSRRVNEKLPPYYSRTMKFKNFAVEMYNGVHKCHVEPPQQRRVM